MENNNIGSDSDFRPFPPSHEEQPPKHSGFGIASFVIGLVAILLVIIGIIVAAVSISDLAGDEQALNELSDLLGTNGGGSTSDLGNELLDSDQFGGLIMSIAVAGFLMIGAVGLSILGAVFGIVGIVAKNRRKAFGIIGLVLNGLIAVGSIGLFIISLGNAALLAP